SLLQAHPRRRLNPLRACAHDRATHGLPLSVPQTSSSQGNSAPRLGPVPFRVERTPRMFLQVHHIHLWSCARCRSTLGMSVRQTLLGVAWAAVIVSGAHECAASDLVNLRFKFSLGYHYSSGTYGTSNTTRISYVPLIAKTEAGNWSVEWTI